MHTPLFSRAPWSMLAMVFLVGCSGPGKREAAALTEAVDRFRAANTDAARSAQAQALATFACSDAKVCDVKRTCVEAVEPTAMALALKNQVTVKLADLEAARLAPDSAEAQELPVKLDEATRLLREGHTKMDECDTKLTELRVTFGS